MNNRDDMRSVEQHIEDLMRKYATPPDTPYEQVASEHRMATPRDEANAKHDRDDIDKHARKLEQIMTRYNIPPGTRFDTIATANPYLRHYDYREFERRFSAEDQKNFDKAYEHWLDDRRKNDRADIAKDEGRMQEIMARYNIPRDVPYAVLASANRGY
jgi:hypothetical protein